MPALPSVPKVVKIVLNGAYAATAGAIINGFHLGYSTGDISLADLTSLVTLIDTAWGTHLSPIFTTAMALDEVIGTSLSSSTAPAASIGSSHAGSVSSQPVPVATCLETKYIVGRRYRGGHPRNYWSGAPAADESTGNTWASAYVTSAETAFAGFFEEILGGAPSGYGTWDQVNVSYYEGFENFTYPSGRVRARPTPRTTPLVDVITNILVNPKMASQRRRNQQSA